MDSFAFNRLIESVGFLDDSDIKNEIVSLLFSVKNSLKSMEMDSLEGIILSENFSDSAKLAAVKSTCNQYL